MIASNSPHLASNGKAQPNTRLSDLATRGGIESFEEAGNVCNEACPSLGAKWSLEKVYVELADHTYGLLLPQHLVGGHANTRRESFEHVGRIIQLRSKDSPVPRPCELTRNSQILVAARDDELAADEYHVYCGKRERASVGEGVLEVFVNLTSIQVGMQFILADQRQWDFKNI
jgi:hypothetical protein